MAQDSEQARPDPELQRLAPLLGTWRAEGRTEESIAGPAGPGGGHTTTNWPLRSPALAAGEPGAT